MKNWTWNNEVSELQKENCVIIINTQNKAQMPISHHMFNYLYNKLEFLHYLTLGIPPITLALCDKNYDILIHEYFIYFMFQNTSPS